MPSLVAHVNRALQHLSASRINDLTEASVNAREANACLAIVRDELLDRHPWGFAMGWARLPALATAPAWGYARAFALPADCLRVWEIAGSDPTQPWTRAIWEDAPAILTDIAAPLDIRYARRIENTELWPVTFAETFSARLAIALAPQLAPSGSDFQRLASIYEAALAQARYANAIESGVQQAIIADDWTGARL